MKTYILSLFVILSFAPLFADYYSNGLAEDIFLGRRPNARYEAMGKTGIAENGHLYLGVLNPASVSELNGLVLNYSMDPLSYYFIDDDRWYSDYCGIGLKYKDFSFALDYYRQDWGDMSRTDEFGTFLGTINDEISLLSFMSAYKIIENFYFGSTLRVTRWDMRPWFDKFGFSIDLGMLKKLEVYSSDEFKYIVNIGASYSNITNSSFLEDSSDDAPMTFRFGISNNFIFKDPNLSRITVNSEFYKILNSYHSGEDDFSFNSGFEINIVRYFFLRCGYYYQLIYDYDSSYNKDHLSEFTYGFGLLLPLNEIFNNNSIPLSFGFDFTALDQPSFSQDDDDNWEEFFNYSFTLKWMFDK
jgi:hypothetical protein